MRFLGIEQVTDRTALSRTTIYKEMKAGRFPKGVPLTTQRVGWLEVEIDDWIATKVGPARASEAVSRNEALEMAAAVAESRRLAHAACALALRASEKLLGDIRTGALKFEAAMAEMEAGSKRRAP